jgi:excisionase family DNA binding protein
MQNPFETIQLELAELKGLVIQLLTKPKEDLSQKRYTVKEAAKLFNVDTQTVRNHIERGNIKATIIGRRILISHDQLFGSLNEVKSLKYKRQA